MSPTPGSANGKTSRSTAATFVTRNVNIVARYNSVIFPIDLGRFFAAVTERGFVIPEAVAAQVSQLGIGGEFRRGDVSLRIDAARMILGVGAPDSATAIAEMTSLESLVRSEFDFDSRSMAYFYEMGGQFSIKGTKSPIECWARQAAQLPLVAQFSQVIGENAMPFGLRVASSGTPVNRTDWFDIHFEPLVQRPESLHLATVIYRHAEREKVIEFTRRIEDALKGLVKLVEA